MATESSAVYQEIEDMLGSYRYGIPVDFIEGAYKKKFETSLDYRSLGVKNIDELLGKMCDKVLFFDHPQTGRKFLTLARLPEIQDVPTEFSKIQDLPTESTPMDVYDTIQYISGCYGHGVAMSIIEERLRVDYNRSLDYDSLGVKDFEGLIDKMRGEGRVVVYVEPESKERCVMSAGLAKSYRKYLKQEVDILLKSHGNVPLRCFEAMYEERFKRKLKYPIYNLTDLDHLCEALNLELEEADSGQKVIKVCNIYNLRKRKMPDI